MHGSSDYESQRLQGGVDSYSQQYSTIPPHDLESGYAEAAPHHPVKLSDDLPIYIRHGFVRKVFAVLSIQLLVTFGLMCLIRFNHSVRLFVTSPEHSWVFILALTVNIVSIITFTCFVEMLTTYPNNYFILGAFTISEGIMLGIAVTAYDVDVLLMAIGVTMAVTVALMLFATQTKYDFTGAGAYLMVGLLVMILFGFIASFFPPSRETNLIYSFAGVMIFSMFIVYDTQLIVGGRNKKYKYEVDHYVLAALAIYLDIINLFIYILQLLNDQNRN